MGWGVLRGLVLNFIPVEKQLPNDGILLSSLAFPHHAGVAKLVDAQDSKSCAFGHEGSSPSSGTTFGPHFFECGLFLCLEIKGSRYRAKA